MGNRMYWILGMVWLYMAMPREAYAQGKNYTQKVNGVSFEMVYVEGGTFMMGATEKLKNQASKDEYPVHEVTLTDYCIGKYEVTQKLWEAVMGSNPSYNPKGGDYPVERVSWSEIQTFLTKLSQQTGRKYTLPTEAQWEYAARGGNRLVYTWCGGGVVAFSGTLARETTVYSGSDNLDKVAWYGGNSGDATHPVGTKQPNALGIYDMSGNVWEWCHDWYDEDYYSISPKMNPTGSSSGSKRILRGGSWKWFYEDKSTKEFRLSGRAASSPNEHYINCGFRLVWVP